MQNGSAGQHVGGVSGSTQAGASDVCVVWVARGGSGPAPLMEALRRRRVTTYACDDPYLALARACRMQRRTDPGANLFIVCDPPRHGELGDMVEALRKHAPRVARWWYEHVTSPNLRPLSREELERWQPQPIHPEPKAQPTPAVLPAPSPVKPGQAPVFSVHGGPPLRLVSGPPGRAHTTVTVPLPPSTALTSEELSMLLGQPTGARSATNPPHPPQAPRKGS